MTSFTPAATWQLADVDPDETPFYASGDTDDMNGNGNGKARDDEDERGSTIVSGFLDVLHKLSSVHVETTLAEAELDAAPKTVEHFAPAPQTTALPVDEAERYAAARVRLLARTYVHGASSEHEARLAIITERLRKLLPPVTQDQWDALGEVADRLDQVGARHQELKDKLGLK